MKLEDFVRESNRIEGITRSPLAREIDATKAFLLLDRITIPALQQFVAACAPHAILREREGLNVRVGNHIAPPGGAGIVAGLNKILDAIEQNSLDAYEAHVAYEDLHPFTDGNGRSGRALWLWMKGGQAPLGFLHEFYYQALEHSRRR